MRGLRALAWAALWLLLCLALLTAVALLGQRAGAATPQVRPLVPTLLGGPSLLGQRLVQAQPTNPGLQPEAGDLETRGHVATFRLQYLGVEYEAACLYLGLYRDGKLLDVKPFDCYLGGGLR